MQRVRSFKTLVPWLITSCVTVGVMVILYVHDEIPLVAPLLMAMAFLLGAIDFVWPRLKLLAGALFRGVFFGVAVESSDAVFGDASFNALAALGVGAAYAVLMGLWEYFHDPEPELASR